MSTGKTSLIQRYVRDAFPQACQISLYPAHSSAKVFSVQNYKPTLGVDFATKLIQFDDTLVRLQFWDISGWLGVWLVAESTTLSLSIQDRIGSPS